jgi:hypothetical protein
MWVDSFDLKSRGFRKKSSLAEAASCMTQSELKQDNFKGLHTEQNNSLNSTERH